MCLELVMPSSHLILCHPLLLVHPIPSSIRVLSNSAGSENPSQYRVPKNLLNTTLPRSSSTIQFTSVMSNSLPPHGLQHTRPPVHHQLPEFTQTHVHQVGDAIQPSRPLSSPSPPAPNPSEHQGLFKKVNSLHEVAKMLEFQPQHQSCQ